jgi:cytosine/adenosine deaminase-related metal-dependent hydrolase
LGAAAKSGLARGVVLILVALTALNLTPVLEAPIRNIVPNLVYAGSGHEVVTVRVAGKVWVRDGEVLVAAQYTKTSFYGWPPTLTRTARATRSITGAYSR